MNKYIATRLFLNINQKKTSLVIIEYCKLNYKLNKLVEIKKITLSVQFLLND
jgi:hypothetical protein